MRIPRATGRLAGSCLAIAMLGAACARDSSRTPRGGAADSTASDNSASASDTVTFSACDGMASGPWNPAPVGKATFDVNRGTRGMASRLRWAIAVDSSAILVVDDPAGVENEAIPNGVLYATEVTGRVFRMDSVWSVAPDPTFRRLALGRAVVLGGGEAQRIPPERWNAAAVALRAIAGDHPALTADSLRARSYPVSGMAVVEGAAATFIADVDRDAPVAPIRFVTLDGWRVRWSCDAADLLVGDRPRRVQDDEPSEHERRVSANGTRLTNKPPFDRVRWTDGPTLDISTPVARGASTRLVLRGRTVEERDGRVVVRDANGTRRDVGPGVPLAATRHGRFILAVAPRTNARPHESPDHAVVYRVP